MQKEPGKRGVLVVDEDATFASRLVEFLRSQGFAASTVGRRHALAAASAERPDLALIDLGLPVESGLRLAGTLRAEWGVQFMALCSEDDAGTARLAAEAGALAYLVKAVHMQHYLSTVHVAVSRTDELRILRDREAQLTQALQQTRAISMATGVLMERSRLSRDDAFDRLRCISRAQRRRLSEVADELLKSVETLNATTGASDYRTPAV
jgi:response regulator NasT